MEKLNNQLIEILIHTKELRRLQRKYFLGRSKFILTQCKDLESKVDRMISKFEIDNGIQSGEVIKQDSIQTELKMPMI